MILSFCYAEICQNWTWIFWESVILVKHLCIGSLMSHWAKKITMTDLQGAVIPIMPYKVLRDLTKLLVSALALLGERLTILLQLRATSKCLLRSVQLNDLVYSTATLLVPLFNWQTLISSLLLLKNHITDIDFGAQS